MAYTEPIGDLTVIPIYNDLMKASVAQGSAYLHAKESVQAMFSENKLTAVEEATIMAKMIGDLSIGITNQAMSAAIQIAKENREGPYVMAKLRADTEMTQANTSKIDKETLLLDSNKDKVDADVKYTTIQGWKLQADIYSKNGINADGQDITAPILNVGSLPKYSMGTDTVGSESVKANIHSTLASSIRKDGNITVAKDASGNITTVTATTPIDECLSGAQTKVAIRQEIAFDDNKVQHAANSSATMIGMLLSTENSSALDASDVSNWRASVAELNTPAP